LSGVSAVIWLEGINDFSTNANAPVGAVESGMKSVVERIRSRVPGVKVIGATVTSALGSSNGAHGSEAEDRKRQALNEFIRTSGIFDGVADFDMATTDPKTGGLRPEFVPDSTIGGAGDKLHPNRAGYLAMAMSVDLGLLGIVHK
jgi:lysophospholipase L1-like esterase